LLKTLTLAAGCAAALMLLAPADVRPSEAVAPPAQTCDESPPPGYTRSIRGLVDGDELVITVSSRFGGAVESLTWRGREFINIWDHGRQISYAWHMDGYGECLNPTEPGSARDYQSPGSTSRLLRVCGDSENRLTTTTQPAYWLAPGESGFCSGGAVTARNESPLSGHLLEKTIEIGYRGLDNVIVFNAVVTLSESYQLAQLEVPTGYLTREFNSYWLYDPHAGLLTRPASDPQPAPWSFAHISDLPPILATADGAYAMGAYSDEAVEYYGIYGTNAANPADRTNKWHIVVREAPAPARAYTYRSFAIVGTLEEVQAAMSELYRMHPVDLDPPTGFIDVANCTEIAGWAWDPKTPDQPVEVEFRALHSDGSETVLGRVRASMPRADLVTALGDNGRHGFAFPASDLIHDGQPVVLQAYALNSVPGLPEQRLNNSGRPLECPAFGPPAPTLEPSPAATAGAAPSAPVFPCFAGFLGPAALAIAFTVRRRAHDAV
jgi:hypothetical protein